MGNVKTKKNIEKINEIDRGIFPAIVACVNLCNIYMEYQIKEMHSFHTHAVQKN